MTIEDMKTRQDSIARIIEVGTYGSEWLYIRISKKETPANVFEQAKKQFECSNEIKAHVLLNGGTLNFHDGYEEDDDEEGKPHITKITLKEWQAGIDKFCKESKRSLANLIAEVEDYYDANNAMQVIMFGEEIY